MTINPCHYSSSNSAASCTDNLLRWRSEVLAPAGVTRLRIRAAYPYRAHWDEAHMGDDDLARLGRRVWGADRDARGKGGGKGGGGKGGGSKGGGGKGGGGAAERAEAIARARTLLANARDGVTKLVSPAAAAVGVSLDPFDEADWAYVLGKCAPALRAAHAEGRAPLDGDAKTARAQLDAFTRGVFDRFRTPTSAGGDAGGAGGPTCPEVQP